MKFYAVLVAAVAAIAPLCASPASAQSLPGGSYVKSCDEISFRGEMLTASCEARDGATVKSRLSAPETCDNGVMNDNGQLRCERENPNGSYTKTCRDIRSGPRSVSATCKDREGRWGELTRYYEPWSCNGWIGNDDGELVCERKSGAR